MVRVNLHYFLFVLLALGSTAGAMKRSVSDTGTSDSTLATSTQHTNSSSSSSEVTTPTLDTSIFQNLNKDLLPTILSYCQMRKSDLILVSTQMYHYFCFKNHFIPDHEAPEGWKKLVENNPELITTNPRDCQRIYYLLIKADNIGLMENLLKIDAHREQNLKELVTTFFKNPLETVVSDKMKQLIYKYCESRNIRGQWCLDCATNGTKANEDGVLVCHTCSPLPSFSSPLHLRVAKVVDDFTDIILTHDLKGLQKLTKEILDMQPVGRFFQQHDMLMRLGFTSALPHVVCKFAHYCSEEMFEQLLSFLKELNIDSHQLIPMLLDALNNSDYKKIELLLKFGVKTHIGWNREEPVLMAYKQAVLEHDYTPLTLLTKYGANLDPRMISYDNYMNVMYIRRLPEGKGYPLHYPEDLDDEDNYNKICSILFGAICSKDLKLVSTLLEGGANPYGIHLYDKVFQLDGTTNLTLDVAQDGTINLTEDGQPNIITSFIPVETDLLELAKQQGNPEIVAALIKAREKFKAKISETSDALLAREPEADSSASDEDSQEAQ